MADVDGYFFNISDGYFSDKTNFIDGYIFDISDGYFEDSCNLRIGTVFNPINPVGSQTHYRLRAWNTITLSYEIWTSIGVPDIDPPSGDPVTGVTIIAEWEE